MKGAKPNNVTKLPMKGDFDPANVPEPPATMSEEGAAVWREIAPVLVMKQRFDLQFRPMFRVWCEAFSDYLKFTDDLQCYGDYFETKTRNGKQEKKRAAWGQRQEVISTLTRLAALYGLSPIDEQRFENDGQGDLLASLMAKLNESN